MKGAFEHCWGRIRNLHFDERNGSPFWIKRAKKFGIHPEKDLSSLEDFLMSKISLCDENELKAKPLEYFVPRSVLYERSFVPMTSSGSTDKKKTVPWTMEAVEHNAEHLSKILKLYGIEERINWLLTGPSDPAPFKYVMDSLVKEMKGTLYFASVETRGLKSHLAVKENDKLDLEKIFSDCFLKAVLGPAVEYTIDVLRREKIEFLGTALFFLPFLENQEGFENVRFVYVGGMEISNALYRFWKRRLEKHGAKLITSYGHFMFGVIFDLPSQSLTYYPPAPLSLLLVTEPDDPFKVVKYGERGRVRYLRMDEAMLWCQQERDYAERAAPHNHFNWDGVKEIKLKWG